MNQSFPKILSGKTVGAASTAVSTWLGDFAACLGTAGRSVSQYCSGGQQLSGCLVRIRSLAHRNIREVALIRV
jgi:hypothetical protein